MVDIFVTLYNCDLNNYDDSVSHHAQEKMLRYSNQVHEQCRTWTICEILRKKPKYHPKKKLVKSTTNRAFLSDYYSQNPIEWANYLVYDKLSITLDAVKIVSITDTVQVTKEGNIRYVRTFTKLFIIMNLTKFPHFLNIFR